MTLAGHDTFPDALWIGNDAAILSGTGQSLRLAALSTTCQPRGSRIVARRAWRARRGAGACAFGVNGSVAAIRGR
jgi:threonine aldolase